MEILTPRLSLTPLQFADHEWVLAINQDPLWLKFIGDRGVSNADQAKEYIYRINAQLSEWGYGLLAVKSRKTQQALGLCGLINRYAFTCPDLGFALLPHARRQGIVFEAAHGVIEWAKINRLFACITAMTHPENYRSQHVLEQLGFNKQGTFFDKGLPGQRLFWQPLM
jgi:ribosomal-protein-alanine N-acetyltransferase